MRNHQLPGLAEQTIVYGNTACQAQRQKVSHLTVLLLSVLH